MNCQEVMDYMQRQLDGDLDERETEILMNHTRHCSDCAAMFERLKLLSAGLESLPKVTPSYSLVDAILPKLAEIQAAAEESSVQPRIVIAGEGTNPPRRVQKSANGWRRWLPMSAVGGAVAAAVIIGMFFLSNNSMHSLRGSDDSGTATADTAASNDSVMNKATSSSSSNADSAAKPESSKDDSNVTARGADKSDSPAASDSQLRKDLRGSVDPNGEAMPPITSGNGQGSSDGAAADQSQSPNYVQSDSGNASGGDSGNAPASDQNQTYISSGNDQDGGTASNSSDTGNAGVQTPDKDKMSLFAPEQVMASPISPNKQFQAFIVDGDTVSIYTVSDSELKYQSATKRTDISDLKWASDNKLTYTAVDADGAKKTFVVDPAAGTEQVQSSK